MGGFQWKKIIIIILFLIPIRLLIADRYNPGGAIDFPTYQRGRWNERGSPLWYDRLRIERDNPYNRFERYMNYYIPYSKAQSMLASPYGYVDRASERGIKRGNGLRRYGYYYNYQPIHIR